MNDELKKKLVEYLGVLEDATKSGVDTAAEQLPEIAQQYVAWQLWSSAILAFVLWCGAGLIGYGSCRLVRHGLSLPSHNPDSAPALVVGGFAGLVSLVLTAHGVGHSLTAIKALVAPKVLVIEELARLIGQVT